MIKENDLTLITFNGEIYERKFFKCLFNTKIEARYTLNGFLNRNTCQVFLKYDKNFMNPKEYQKNHQENNYTFKKGDLLIKGIYEDEINSIAELKENIDNAFIIENVIVNEKGNLKSIEINGS